MSTALQPATLPGTPSQFPISAPKLIELAKALFEAESGIKDDSLLAQNFRFEFPIVSLSRADFLKTVRGFDLKAAFPDLNSHPYDWRVDPFEPNRVWFTTRTTATHTGPLKLGPRTIPATGKVVLGAPEALSYTFDSHGKATSFTGGYILDRRVGNTNKLGALFGILSAIGQPVPGDSVFGSLRNLAFHGFAAAQGLLEFASSAVFGRKKEQ